MSLTKDEEAKVLQWLGKWEPGQNCAWCREGLENFYQAGDDVVPTGIRHINHNTQPPLTKADAIDALEKLPPLRLVHTYDVSAGDTPWDVQFYFHPELYHGVTPAEAIFRAVLAYRDAQEKK